MVYLSPLYKMCIKHISKNTDKKKDTMFETKTEKKRGDRENKTGVKIAIITSL